MCAPLCSPKVWIFLAGVVVCVIVVGGCSKREEIRSYDVPKTPAPTSATEPQPANPADANDRMIAVTVFPEGMDAWFFKIAGRAAMVDAQEQAFKSFVESAKFTGKEPTWTAPEGWRAKQAGMMQHTAFDAGDPPVEVSVARLSKPNRDDAEYLLANVNRWRGQMSLPAIGPGELAKNIQERPIGSIKATWVDLRGTLQKGMRPPFAR